MSERIINLATALVLQEEANYVNALRRQMKKTQEVNPAGAGELAEDLLEELQRLNPKRHSADEEEVRIHILERKIK